jgi:hypothetical protein
MKFDKLELKAQTAENFARSLLTEECGEYTMGRRSRAEF